MGPPRWGGPAALPSPLVPVLISARNPLADTRSLVDPTSGPLFGGHRARTTHFPGWVESLCPGLGLHSLVAPTSLFASLHREEGLCVLSGETAAAALTVKRC